VGWVSEIIIGRGQIGTAHDITETMHLGYRIVNIKKVRKVGRTVPSQPEIETRKKCDRAVLSSTSVAGLSLTNHAAL
jgi:hypothetical protein